MRYGGSGTSADEVSARFAGLPMNDSGWILVRFWGWCRAGNVLDEELLPVLSGWGGVWASDAME